MAGGLTVAPLCGLGMTGGVPGEGSREGTQEGSRAGGTRDPVLGLPSSYWVRSETGPASAFGLDRSY